jgi:hypothetical protein
MLLTLFVVPSAYVVFNEAGERLRVWLVGEPAVGGTAAAVATAGVAAPTRAVRAGRGVEVGGDG